MNCHFMGIGGVGMAGVAFLLKKAGHAVTGCDKCASPRTRWLEANGIPVATGHDAAHVAAGVERLVVTPAVPETAPELVAARAANGVAVSFRGEALAELFNAAACGVAICGTHGKTTTATYTARLLRLLGADPSWCIGGEAGSDPVAGVGRGPFVVEADESDGTLALYRARILVITSLDYDHADHFKTHADYLACYDRAAAQAETVIRAETLADGAWPELGRLVLGAHNVRNALCAIAVCRELGFAEDAIRAALPKALADLPDRRFQRIWPPVGEPGAAAFSVIADYAHHPREIACAVEMARSLKPKRLRVLFQPHRHSRTKALKDDFAAVLKTVDELVLLPVYAAFEKPLLGGDAADLYKALRDGETQSGSASSMVKLARNPLEAWRHAFLTRRDGDLVILLGAGDVIGLVPRVLRDMESEGGDSGKIVYVGAGTNTWRSDLATDEIYVKTDGPAGRPGASLGIPWMAGVPGTIGGWTKMNAGAFGHSVSEVIRRVKVDGVWRAAADCGFAYRHSDVVGEIQDVEFDEAKLAAARADGSAADYLAKRKKFPPGTKGSVFKNPPGDFAGRLLEEAGAKTLRVGGARVWEEHANVIVLAPGAPASDFLALARLMAARVLDRFGVTLEPEVQGLQTA
ncbi:MAG: Mur ligase domain-containing protein [Kiritimatiellae bacterium]|nr:Mur ligase domain-containing protein [Kiritimatiellia bacterium]